MNLVSSGVNEKCGKEERKIKRQVRKKEVKEVLLLTASLFCFVQYLHEIRISEQKSKKSL